MADFRKSLLLAGMTLAIGVGTASAQTGKLHRNIWCAPTPPFARLHGANRSDRSDL